MSEISDPKCTPYGMEASQKEKNKEREKLDVMLFPGEDFRYCSVVAFMGNIVTVPVIVSYTEFSLKTIALLHETPYLDMAIRVVNSILT